MTRAARILLLLVTWLLLLLGSWQLGRVAVVLENWWTYGCGCPTTEYPERILPWKEV